MVMVGLLPFCVCVRHKHFVRMRACIRVELSRVERINLLENVDLVAFLDFYN